jgi:integrase
VRQGRPGRARGEVADPDVGGQGACADVLGQHERQGSGCVADRAGGLREHGAHHAGSRPRSCASSGTTPTTAASRPSRATRSAPCRWRHRWPHACARSAKGGGGDELVLRPERGAQALSGSALCLRFVAAADDAGLRRIRFHDLRHSFGTQAIQRFDVYTVQRWLGHKSITTTEKYLHYRADANAAQAMDALWQTSDQVAEVIPLARAA